MNLLITLVFIFFVFLIGLIPFPLLYLFSDFIRFILQRVAGYRKKVILQNLQETFPEMDEKKRKKLLSEIYRNLADITVESLKGFSMSARQVRKRHYIKNPELIESYILQGRSVIGLPAHFNNWEWGSLSPGLFVKHPIIAFYKPLSNKYIDRFLKRSRSKFGTTLSSIYITALTFERNAQIPSIYVMAADQSPTNRRKSYWVPFLGRDTAFLHGPEFYARKHDIPVFYVDVQRVRRGYYTLEVSLLTDIPCELPDGEITRRYAAKLEEAILATPGSWLWSHRRWKMKKED